MGRKIAKSLLTRRSGLDLPECSVFTASEGPRGRPGVLLRQGQAGPPDPFGAGSLETTSPF